MLLTLIWLSPSTSDYRSSQTPYELRPVMEPDSSVLILLFYRDRYVYSFIFFLYILLVFRNAGRPTDLCKLIELVLQSGPSVEPACGKPHTFCVTSSAMQMWSNSGAENGGKITFIHFMELQPSCLTPDKQTELPFSFA